MPLDVSDDDEEPAPEPIGLPDAANAEEEDEEEEDDVVLDDAEEEDDDDQENAADPEPVEEVNDAEVEDEVVASLPSRPAPPVVDTTASLEAAEAPSLMEQEKQARENGGCMEEEADDAIEQDPDVVRDEGVFKEFSPIFRETGKSKTCFNPPFASVVHMPHKTATGEPLELYEMSAETFAELGQKSVDTTNAIVSTLTPAKLAQCCWIFKVGVKPDKSHALRHFAAFLPVKILDAEVVPGLKETLGDHTPFYQMVAAKWTSTFKSDHSLKLPRSVLPISKTVAYLKLSPAAEYKASPSTGWLQVPTRTAENGRKPPQPRKDSKKATEGAAPAGKKQKTGEGATDSAVLLVNGGGAAPSALQQFAFVPDPSESAAERVTLPISAPAVEASPAADPPVQATAGSTSAAILERYDYEKLNFDLSRGATAWPTFKTNIPFTTNAYSVEVAFKVTYKG